MSKLAERINIGAVTLDSRVFLAPMAGYTDLALRTLAAEAGAAMTVTEMVSARGLLHSGGKSAELLRVSSAEKVKCAQLFGSDPADFYEVIKNTDYLSAFDVIDINMGCPVPKIVRNGEGSALMLDPEKAEKIVAACVKATDKPITVKTRTGFNEGDFTAAEFCRRMQGAGAAAITLHGRTRALGYAGESDYRQIETVKNVLSVPLFGSGDVTADNAETLAAFCDGLAIGRGAVGDPWIFSRILGKRENPAPKETLIRHIGLLEKYYGERYALVNARKYYGKYISGHRDLKVKLMQAADLSSVRALIFENL